MLCGLMDIKCCLACKWFMLTEWALVAFSMFKGDTGLELITSLKSFITLVTAVFEFFFCRRSSNRRTRRRRPTRTSSAANFVEGSCWTTLSWSWVSLIKFFNSLKPCKPVDTSLRFCDISTIKFRTAWFLLSKLSNLVLVKW